MAPTSVLTTQSSVTCADAAVVQTASSAKLRVGVGPARAMAPVLLFAEVPDKAVLLCPVRDNTSTGVTTCRQVKSVSEGASAVLTVRGEPVALGSLTGITDGVAVAAPPQWRGLVVDARQTRLRAD